MFALRSLFKVFFIVVLALVATWLQGCGGNCEEQGCKYEEDKTTDEDKKAEIDEYLTWKKEKDCCIQPQKRDKIKADATALNHRASDVENAEACK